ncbi:hypothetical protein C8R47DRAFT_1084402 [Mycena vitilis]|nr:hypothetical protein C8R47DRAFT_1084402 [Mycena vitilis]
MAYTPEEARLVQAWNSANYNDRNREERNAKKRVRMAALRQRQATMPPEIQEARAEARRAAAKKYRDNPEMPGLWHRERATPAQERARSDCTSVSDTAGDLQLGEPYANLNAIFSRAFAQGSKSCSVMYGNLDVERVELDAAYQNHAWGCHASILDIHHEYELHRLDGRAQAAAAKCRFLRAIRLELRTRPPPTPSHCELDHHQHHLMDATRSPAPHSAESTPDFSGKQFYTPSKSDDGYQACSIPFLPGPSFKNHERVACDGRSHYHLVYGGPDGAVALYTPGEAYTSAMRLTDRGVRPKSIQRGNVGEIDEILLQVCRGGHLGCRTRNHVSGPMGAPKVDNGLEGTSHAMVIAGSGTSNALTPSTPPPAWCDGTWYCYGAGFITRDEGIVSARAATGARLFVRETFKAIVTACRQMHGLSPGELMYFVLDNGMVTSVSGDALESYLKIEVEQASIFTSPLFGVARRWLLLSLVLCFGGQQEQPRRLYSLPIPPKRGVGPNEIEALLLVSQGVMIYTPESRVARFG